MTMIHYVAAGLCLTSITGGNLERPPAFEDEGTPSPTPRWSPFLDPGKLVAEDGYRVAEGKRDAAWLASMSAAREVAIQADFRISRSGRMNFGVVLGARGERNCLMLRHYDGIRGLQLLRFENGTITRTENGPARVTILPGRWYRMKVIAVGGELLARTWPVDAPEPEWQFKTRIEDLPEGRVGLTVQECAVDVDNVRIWTDVAVREWDAHRQELEAERRRRRIESMTLEVTPTPYLMLTEEGPQQRIEVRATVGHETEPVGGRIRIAVGDTEHGIDVEPHFFQAGATPVYIKHVTRPTKAHVAFKTDHGNMLEAEAIVSPLPERMQALTSPGGTPARDYRHYVRKCLDTLIRRGTDRYGKIHSPMMMAVIDVKTRNAPESPDLLDSAYRTEGRPDHGRRSPGGSNLWLDQPLISAMYRLSELTGDTAYADAADDYIRAAFTHAVRKDGPRKGLLYWGSHSYYDAYQDRDGGDRGVHEILILHPLWEEMYRVDPEGVTREIEQIWNHHIRDKTTGLHNRHDSDGSGDFAFSGGSFCIAFSFLYEKTGDTRWLDRALLIANYHFAARDTATQLAPTAPESSRCAACFNGHFCNTQLTGPFASQMLRCYVMTGVPRFREIAETFIKAYDTYGWDSAAGSFYGALRLDGTPLKSKSEWNDYIWAPDGYVEVWRTIVCSWEFPLISAQTSVWAYELSGRDRASRDPRLLEIALRWGKMIERELPPQIGHRWRKQVHDAMPRAREVQGAYAENYGRAIATFVGLHHATGETWYLNRARQLANEAIDKLYTNGLFRGHPAKGYYESCDGVGTLMQALLYLDAIPEQGDMPF